MARSRPKAPKAAKATKAVKAAKSTTAAKAARPPKAATLRFAHPFFTPLAPEDPNRPVVAGVGQRMTDHIKQKLQPIPPLNRTPPTITLADIIGQAGSDDIAHAGSITFHAVGDTGRGANTPQGEVADAMALDFNVKSPATSPAFFFHLGDVIYGHNKDQKYRPEFYEPYMHYPGKIIAIAGNHDGEVFPTTDTKSCGAFIANFCAKGATVPPIAGTIFRQTMTQPDVYWLLDGPFLQIVGLYSNVAENPGYISGPIPGQAQKTWLVNTLTQLAQQRAQGPRKALIFATHHPPLSTGHHKGSSDMLTDIDDACKKANLLPDAFLSGHSHTYQRYTRRVTFGGKALEIPFVVAGTGGISDQPVPAANGQASQDDLGQHTYDKSLKGFGYLQVTTDGKLLTIKMTEVQGTVKKPFDQVVLDLTTGKIRP